MMANFYRSGRGGRPYHSFSTSEHGRVRGPQHVSRHRTGSRHWGFYGYSVGARRPGRAVPAHSVVGLSLWRSRSGSRGSSRVYSGGTWA